jgi:hypothetical protein
MRPWPDQGEALARFLRWQASAACENARMMRSFALYRRVGHRFVEGWVEPEVLDVVRILDATQRAHSVAGAVAEIGVHHGKFFIGLHLLGRGAALAVDVFGDQHLNVDQSGCGNRERFVRNVKRWATMEGVVIHQGDSTDLTAGDTVFRLLGPIRLFSIDGGHTVDTVLSDLKLAEQVLAEGGVVIGDDVFNERWPDVSVATLQYLNSSKLSPFAIGFNKVFFTQPAYAEAYRLSLANADLGLQFDSTYTGHDVTLLLRRR